jgi:glycosyltransferase involved in cell wall biosynthesis
LLFVHERFGTMAGAEINALLTAAELRQRGHTVGIVHGAAGGGEGGGWRRAFSHCFSWGEGDGEAPKAMRAAVNEFRPEVIYVHKLADLKVLEALVECGTPLVRMVHDHDLYCMRSYKYHPVTRRICRRAASAYCVFPCGAILMRNRESRLPVKWLSYAAKQKELRLNRRFQRMVVATGYMRDELVRNRFDQRKIEIHAPAPRASESAPPSTFSERNLILYAGQIVRGKGVDVLLESLSQVETDFTCIILGEGSHRPFCEALSRKLGLGQRVRFYGFVPQSELSAYYREGSVAVMSSVWPEPFGAAGLEGMCHGLPVVAFDAGGIREWLIDGHNGFLVPWMDRQAFAARVEQLLRNKALARQMGERGCRLVRQKYDFARYVGSLERMFAQVVQEAQAKAGALAGVHEAGDVA